MRYHNNYAKQAYSIEAYNRVRTVRFLAAMENQNLPEMEELTNRRPVNGGFIKCLCDQYMGKWTPTGMQLWLQKYDPFFTMDEIIAYTGSLRHALEVCKRVPSTRINLEQPFVLTCERLRQLSELSSSSQDTSLQHYLCCQPQFALDEESAQEVIRLVVESIHYQRPDWIRAWSWLLKSKELGRHTYNRHQHESVFHTLCAYYCGAAASTTTAFATAAWWTTKTDYDAATTATTATTALVDYTSICFFEDMMQALLEIFSPTDLAGYPDQRGQTVMEAYGYQNAYIASQCIRWGQGGVVFTIPMLNELVKHGIWNDVLTRLRQARHNGSSLFSDTQFHGKNPWWIYLLSDLRAQWSTQWYMEDENMVYLMECDEPRHVDYVKECLCLCISLGWKQSILWLTSGPSHRESRRRDTTQYVSWCVHPQQRLVLQQQWVPMVKWMVNVARFAYDTHEYVNLLPFTHTPDGEELFMFFKELAAAKQEENDVCQWNALFKCGYDLAKVRRLLEMGIGFKFLPSNGVDRSTTAYMARLPAKVLVLLAEHDYISRRWVLTDEHRLFDIIDWMERMWRQESNSIFSVLANQHSFMVDWRGCKLRELDRAAGRFRWYPRMMNFMVVLSQTNGCGIVTPESMEWLRFWALRSVFLMVNAPYRSRRKAEWLNTAWMCQCVEILWASPSTTEWTWYDKEPVRGKREILQCMQTMWDAWVASGQKNLIRTSPQLFQTKRTKGLAGRIWSSPSCYTIIHSSHFFPY